MRRNFNIEKNHKKILSITARFCEYIVLTVEGKRIEVHLHEIGSNQAKIGFVMDRDVLALREDYDQLCTPEEIKAGEYLQKQKKREKNQARLERKYNEV